MQAKVKIFHIIQISAILVFALTAGLFSGRVAGNYIFSDMIKGGNAAMLLYRISFEYFMSSSLLTSGHELDRLEGYYSLLDMHKTDAKFLIERYKNETDLNKLTITWLLGFSKDKKTALQFLSKEYPRSDERQKQEILKTMERIDRIFYRDFVKPKRK